jgi:hypothetical protein
VQKEREDYEVVIEDGKFMFKNSRQILNTSGGSRDAKWIFVLSTSKSLYVGQVICSYLHTTSTMRYSSCAVHHVTFVHESILQKKKGTFQHSSFLAGGATSAAGRLVVEDGVLKAIWPHSGHYRPTEENFQEFQSFLKDKSVDLTDVKMSPDEDDEEFWSRLKSIPSDCCAAADKPEEDETVAAQDTSPRQEPLVTTEATTPEEVSVSEHEQTRTNLKPIAIVTRQDSSEDAAENAETSTTSDSASLRSSGGEPRR